MEVEFAAKLGASLVLLLLGRLSPRIWSWVQYRYAKSFWRPVVDNRLSVVVGRHELSRFEPSGLIGVGDAKAVDLLRVYLRKLYLPSDFRVRYVDEIPMGRSYDGTFMCLGGPDASPQGEGVIADLWREAKTSYVWHGLAIRDRESGKHFRPDHQSNGTVTRDYALIVRMLNPFSQSGGRDYVLLFAGCFGFGTWGAARFATTTAFLKDSRVARAEEFECLLSVEVANRSPAQTEMLSFRELGERSTPSANTPVVATQPGREL